MATAEALRAPSTDTPPAAPVVHEVAAHAETVPQHAIHPRAGDILHIRALVHTMLQKIHAAGHDVPPEFHDQLGLNGSVTTPLVTEGVLALPLMERSEILHQIEHLIRCLSSHSHY